MAGYAYGSQFELVTDATWLKKKVLEYYYFDFNFNIEV